MNKLKVIAMCVALPLFGGCYSSHKVEMKSTHEIKPLEIKPIHIKIDINVKVDRALDDFFGDLDKKSEKLDDKKGDVK